MRRVSRFLHAALGALTLTCLFFHPLRADDPALTTGSHDHLISLFNEFRMLARPVTPDGVPDYTARTMTAVHAKLLALRRKLENIDRGGWPIEQQVDYELLRAEMNGLDFHIRVLKPWVRDPAFYALIWTDQSDTPAHEGPTSHAAIELWMYSFPLKPDDARKLSSQLKLIPPLLNQARTNLVGNARDLWTAGIKNIHDQIADLDDLAQRTAGAGSELQDAIAQARAATLDFVVWLEQQAPSKSGPSGVGKDEYTWHLRNVLLVPLSWEEEVSLLKRELNRAYTMLALEKHHNRNLPALKPAASPEEFAARTDASINKFMAFLDQQEILPVKNYMEPELRKHTGKFQPDEKRIFFSKILHLEPNVLYAHLTHWFEIAQMRDDPHPNPMRRDPLLFNIWMSRSEGLATGVEEMFMHAGLFDDNPRARELVWIMLAQRCARGLASLYAHANEFDFKAAREYQIAWTPSAWEHEDLSLVGFEQQLYLRQPGYGTCYISGKYLIEQLITDRSRQLGNNFRLKSFFEEMYAVGMLPVSLIRWQMTGLDNEIQGIKGR